MQNRIQSVLLIDDSDATNNYNKRLIERFEFAEDVQIALNGKAAIEYLLSHLNNLPELIFLDVNMPNMDGFIFLKELQLLQKQYFDSIKVILLTTSILETDRLKAKDFNQVIFQTGKPLTKEALQKIEKIYFENS